MSIQQQEESNLPGDETERRVIRGDDNPRLKYNLFVKAGAGAGKTQCIQERVANTLLHTSCDCSKLAVITYGRKASLELKERVRSTLELASVNAIDKETRDRAQYQLSQLNQAKICTVHAFCFDLMREYPVEFGIDPYSQIADERLSDLIKRQVQRRFYEAEASGDKRFRKEFSLREKLLGIDDNTLFNAFATFYENRELSPKRLQLRAAKARTTTLQEALGVIENLIRFLLIDIESAIKKPNDTLYRKLPEILEVFQELSVTVEDKSSHEILLEHLIHVNRELIPKIGNKSNYKLPDKLTRYKEQCQELKSILANIDQDNAIEQYNLMLDIYPAYKQLYDEFKRESKILDFADCLVITRDKLQSHEFLRSSLQKRFDLIIVDEFQDSDPLQAEIVFHLSALSPLIPKCWHQQKLKPGKVLLMGDPKQSIYGFARADLAIYLKVQHAFQKQHADSQVSLSTNFRSSPQLLDFINKHFSTIIHQDSREKSASPDYEEMTSYRSENSTEAGVFVLELTLHGANEPKENQDLRKNGSLSAKGTRVREAWLVARFIKEEIDKGRAKPGDFKILFRKSAGMQDYEDALDRIGVPCQNNKTSDFLKEPDVIGLVAILGLLVDPENLHLLIALCRSSYLGMTDQDIREVMDQCTDRENLANAAQFHKILSKLYDIAQTDGPLPERFEKACKALGIYSSAVSSQRHDILSSIKKLRSTITAELELSGFDEFVAFDNILGGCLESNEFQRNKTVELKEERLILEHPASTKVELMTIHAAKGLESRYIILANPESTRMDDIDKIIDRENGDIILPKTKVAQQDLSKVPQLAQDFNRETIYKQAEEKRALYVAVTRAREKLFIVRYKNQIFDSFYEPLEDAVKSLPFIPLGIDDDYHSRYFQSREIDQVKVATTSIESHDEQKKQSLKSLYSEAPNSKAVTDTLNTKDIFYGGNIGKKRGREIGIFVHELMEWVGLRCSMKQKTSRSELLDLASQVNLQRYNFSDDVIKQVEVGLGRFLESSLYEAILSANEVFVEVQFQILGHLHGIIDLIYRDQDGYHVIDWKTDEIPDEARKDQLKTHYNKQLDAYCQVISQELGGQIVSRNCIFLFENI